MGLRIAQVAPYFHPHVGGVESHVETISQELARRGHDVVVVTSRQPGAPAAEARDGYRVVRAPQLVNLFNTPVTRSVGAILDDEAPDLVHSHSPPPLTANQAARWRARGGAPHVLTHHCDLEIPVPGGRLVVGAFERTMGRYTVGHADRVVATTRTYASTSRALWRRDDVHVIPNPVDAERFHPGVDGAAVRERWSLEGCVVALFVGRLAPHKGVEHFIRAAASTGPNVRHVVVGDGARRQALESLAAQTEGGHKVVFAGRVPGRDLPAYYAAADVGVLPSNSRLEAFGIAALEGMASGNPVVVSDIPGVTEVIEDGATGLLADPLNASDLAEKINRLAGDRKARETMGRRARERVLGNFTKEAVVDRLEKVYAAALE